MSYTILTSFCWSLKIHRLNFEKITVPTNNRPSVVAHPKLSFLTGVTLCEYDVRFGFVKTSLRTEIWKRSPRAMPEQKKLVSILLSMLGSPASTQHHVVIFIPGSRSRTIQPIIDTDYTTKQTTTGSGITKPIHPLVKSIRLIGSLIDCPEQIDWRLVCQNQKEQSVIVHSSDKQVSQAPSPNSQSHRLLLK